MSAEHSSRWQHRTHAAPTSHWSKDLARVHPGTVEACPDCDPPEEPEA